MPLSIPTLDDRRYQDLLNEALARIPVHNPEWTNFNRSDPGVTLIEIFAFLTETLLYRANQIPERNRRKFLSLLGVPLQAASSARGLVTVSNERGLLQTITLSNGLEARAGQVPFRTVQGVDVLPIEAQAFYKRPLPDASDELKAYYRELYASLGAQTPSPNIQLYETVPFPVRDPLATGGALNAVDGSIWIALLIRPADQADPDARSKTVEAIAQKTLSLGVVPLLSDARRALLPGGRPNPAEAPVMRYEIPLIPAGGALPTKLSDRLPQYRSLEPKTTRDVMSEPGVVQITLPAAPDLALWSNLDPLESGVGDFPPTLDDEDLTDRVITWLRLRATAALPSQLMWVGINATEVMQRARVLNELLPAGTGEPDQSAVLANTPVIPRSVRLTVAGERWEEIDDLTAAGPEVPVPDLREPPGRRPGAPSRSDVFAVNLESGEISFGDGLRGKRPPLGATIRADYDYGAGRAGNVEKDAITDAPALPAGLKVTNPVRTWGGAEGETVAEGEKQIARYLQHRDRLVTAEDFESIARRTPGVDIGRIEVIPAFNPELPQNEPGDAPGAVTLMLIPKYDPAQPDAPLPDRPFLDAMCAYLDPRRLVTTEVFLRGPTYKPIWVSVGIDVVAASSVAQVRETVKRDITRFLSPLPPPDAGPLGPSAAQAPGERQNGWPLRKSVVALEIVGVANRARGVLLVNNVLVAQGSNPPEAQVRMLGLELPRLMGISVTVGDARPIDELRGQVTPAPSAAEAGAGGGDAGGAGAVGPLVPVPVIPEQC
jgi:hypothetical protein